MQEHLDACTQRNATSMAIATGQSLSELREYAEHNGITYPLLLDADQSVIKSYGVYHWFGLAVHNFAYNVFRPTTFIADKLGYPLYNSIGLADRNLRDSIARPATVIIDELGVVRYMYIGSNQFDFAEPEAVLAHLTSLHSETH